MQRHVLREWRESGHTGGAARREFPCVLIDWRQLVTEKFNSSQPLKSSVVKIWEGFLKWGNFCWWIKDQLHMCVESIITIRNILLLADHLALNSIWFWWKVTSKAIKQILSLSGSSYPQVTFFWRFKLDCLQKSVSFQIQIIADGNDNFYNYTKRGRYTAMEHWLTYQKNIIAGNINDIVVKLLFFLLNVAWNTAKWARWWGAGGFLKYK